jgi:hypothetical protein
MEPAPGAPLAGEHHVLRYVGGRDFDIDKGTVDGGAFLRKKKDTDGLSVNWLDGSLDPLRTRSMARDRPPGLPTAGPAGSPASMSGRA